LTSYSKRKISRWVLPAYTKRIGGENTLEGMLSREASCPSCVAWVVDGNAIIV